MSADLRCFLLDVQTLQCIKHITEIFERALETVSQVIFILFLVYYAVWGWDIVPALRRYMLPHH
jgi:hypothetical protein